MRSFGGPAGAGCGGGWARIPVVKTRGQRRMCHVAGLPSGAGMGAIRLSPFQADETDEGESGVVADGGSAMGASMGRERDPFRA